MAKAAKIGYKVVALAFAIPAGMAAKKAVAAAWKTSRKNDPPVNPAAPGTTWPEALAWAAVSGIVYGAARMVAARGAAGAWQTLTGNLPPGLDDSTA